MNAPARPPVASLSDTGTRKRGRPATMLDAAADLAGDRSLRMIDAAYDLLEEAGLEGLTIRAVLTRTGLSRRAFYERFVGKDDLVLAVFEHTIRMAAAHYAAQLTSVADPFERLQLVVHSIALARGSVHGSEAPDGSHPRGAALSREHIRLAESRPQELQAALQPLLSLLTQLLEDGMASGQIRRSRPDRLATLIYNLVATTVHAQLLAEETDGPDKAMREDLAADIWEFCRRAVAA
ncbi:TetR/AcrR family transcriptional regulator [Sphingobium sufflavum]|uniref:TetR/AcrR family transcriptional regulator n=1 Tax=Sphingobium sufflavum TaxID=1129547 RepID=UPI001F3C1911|nr:TetR/AcrR family transcriptional regulator [Sphingobium sufflavum]MCE7797066.1 TetR/AcrR family transcriptional regulator [Sphingobium sufflavum]